MELAGTYKVHPAAIEVGVASATPVVRVMREDDNTTVIPWTPAVQVTQGENFTGSFQTELVIPAGGLYRIETSLETRSTLPNLTWLYRGGLCPSWGVGNLFLIAGQSIPPDTGRITVRIAPSVRTFVPGNRNQWDLAKAIHEQKVLQPDLFPTKKWGYRGIALYFLWQKYYELTGVPVGPDQTAQGGSSIERWNPKDGDLYGNMMNKIRGNKGALCGSPVVSRAVRIPGRSRLRHMESIFGNWRKPCALPWVMRSPSSLCS